MAEITIQSVNVGRFQVEDFGEPGGGRVYYIKYDIPGMPWLDGHVHTIPAAALANHRIMTAEQDPMVSMDYYLREVMTSIQAHRVLGPRKVATLESSPVCQNAKAWMALVDKVNEEVLTLSSTLPVQSKEEVPWMQADLQEIVLTPITAEKQPLVTIKPAIAKAASRLGTAQETFGVDQAQILTPHVVDTSVAPWGALQQMVADDTEELGTETDAWFESRYGDRIRLLAGYRLRGE